ncbi:uncharacterized protein LOC143500472 [Brachyhypopomus gauderio]|uniref:uncharacterized protein LOC143500472 n=1 Tax=Brachyhypopomus gauderio TaxID=698409 RepID=UPI00404339C5
MAGVMAPIMQITLLITSSVMCQCGRVPKETGSLDKTVRFNKIQNEYEVKTQRSIVLCWVCKVTFHEVMSLAVHEIKKEVKAMCRKFKSFENSCIKQAYKYEAIAIRLLFHGANAEEVCRHAEMCK